MIIKNKIIIRNNQIKRYKAYTKNKNKTMNNKNNK